MPTLEELDGEDWGEPDYPSKLVTTCHRLRKKNIDQFTIEDFRILVGQGIGMPYLLPRVLDILDRDAFAGGDFYPGDLLSALTREANASVLAGVRARLKPILERALVQLSNLSDQSLPDGRFIGSELETTLTEQFKTCLQNI